MPLQLNISATICMYTPVPYVCIRW